MLLRSSSSIAILRQQQKNIRALASMSWVYDITYKIFQTHGKEKLISIVKLIDMYLSHFSPVVNACCIPESCSAYHLKTKKYFEGLTVTFQIRIIYWLPSYLWMVPLLSQDISLVDNMVVQSKSFFVSVSNHFLFSWGIGLCFWVTGDYWSITWWNALSPLGTSDWCYFDVADCNGKTAPFLFNMISWLLEQDMYWFMPCQFFVLLMLDTFTLLMPCRISIAAGY